MIRVLCSRTRTELVTDLLQMLHKVGQLIRFQRAAHTAPKDQSFLGALLHHHHNART